VNGTASAPRDRRKRRITGHIQRVWTIAADPGAEANLAWAVAEAVKPRLSIVERDHVLRGDWVGEMFTAIHWLIRSAARDRIVLSGELVQRCGRLDAYVGHAEQRLLTPVEKGTSNAGRKVGHPTTIGCPIEGCSLFDRNHLLTFRPEPTLLFDRRYWPTFGPASTAASAWTTQGCPSSAIRS
jgi:hypothetical protein